MNKKNLLISALVSGIIAGSAFADTTAAPAGTEVKTDAAAPTADANSCGEKGKKAGGKKKAGCGEKKKKSGCSGKSGCGEKK